MPKNVLFILSDEFRADCLAAVGNPVIQTPNLDALAREGALFRNCFVQTSPCGPSRMSIYTGRYLCSTGCLDNMTPLAEAEDNLAMHLRGYGFSPAIMGYNDYAIDPRTLPDGHPHKTGLSYEYFLPGFDVVLDHERGSDAWFADLRAKGYPEGLLDSEAIHQPKLPPEGPGNHLPICYPAHYRAEDSDTQFLTTKAIEYIRGQGDRDWFLSLNFLKPHGPYLCPEPYHAMYDPADVPPATRRPEELDSPHPYLARFKLNGIGQLANKRECSELRAIYYGMISELDASLGRLFEALKTMGLWENTLIIFSADHGSHMGDHYLTGKAHFFDSAMHVAYILRDPSPEADPTRGRILEGFIEAVDTAPTICEYVGVPAHERFQGRSVLGMVRARPNAMSKERIFYEFYYYNSLKDKPKDAAPEECRLWVVRDNKYKYVQFGEESMPPLLFDLKTDPGEFTDLAGRPDYDATVAAYCQQLIRWRIRNEDTRMEGWARQYR